MTKIKDKGINIIPVPKIEGRNELKGCLFVYPSRSTPIYVVSESSTNEKIAKEYTLLRRYAILIKGDSRLTDSVNATVGIRLYTKISIINELVPSPSSHLCKLSDAYIMPFGGFNELKS